MVTNKQGYVVRIVDFKEILFVGNDDNDGELGSLDDARIFNKIQKAEEIAKEFKEINKRDDVSVHAIHIITEVDPSGKYV